MENLPDKIPKHIAIILDGNGRWAKAKGLPRNIGHAQGAKTLEEVIEACDDFGVKYLTIYAFSTENWSRPDSEVNALMKLMVTYLKKCIKQSIKHKMRVRIIGDKSALNDEINAAITELEETSKDFDGLNLQIALNYGSRDEMLRAFRSIASDIKTGEIEIDDIDDALIAERLDTKDIPDPDFLIRTSGEKRLSNFLLWQVAYSEMYFPDVCWPDFGRESLREALFEYASRDRRFGGINKEEE